MKQKGKIKNKYPIGFYLILLIAAATFITGVTASKYVVGASSGEEANVAAPQINISADSSGSSKLAFSFPPMQPDKTGEAGELAKNEVSAFILNFNGSVVNETALSYNIDISSSGNIPLIFSVYRVNDDNTETLIPGSSVELLLPGKAKAQKYKIYVQWDKTATNYNNFMYSDEIDWLVVSVNWTQVD